MMINSKMFSGARALVLALLLTGFASAEAKHDPFPNIRLPKRESKGSEAVHLLGNRIGQVAKHYGTDATKLAKLLENDSSLRVDDRGLLRYSEDVATATSAYVSNPTPDLIPESETFYLHSRPAATAKIYLSFQGTTVSGTSWNVNGSIVATPFSIDADPALSSEELRRIRAVWLRVAEDFAAFNVDVTTQNGTMDPAKNIEIIFTPNSQWYGSAGGVCYVGSFVWGSERQVCWVFSTLLGNNEKYIAEAASHETGHALNLRHWAQFDANGTQLASYYAGAGSWAPIMGVGYYRPTTTWSKGEYRGAGVYGLGSLQNDITTIAGITGYAPDEAGGTTGSSSRLARTTDASGAITIDHGGAISSATDTDLYRIDVLGGDIRLVVDPKVLAPNLDAIFRVRDASGSTLFTADPVGIASVPIDLYAVAPGTYYLEITPTGYGDPLVDGYSSYGSNGEYYVRGSYLPSSSDTGPGPNPTPSPSPSPTPNPTPTPSPGNPPTISVTSPAPNAVVLVRTNITVTVNASDDRGLQSVSITANGRSICTKAVTTLTATVSCGYRTANKPATISIGATVTDIEGKTASAAPISISVVR